MSIVVTGFASLDYAVRLDRPAEPDRTATILSRPSEWPRLGGSPAYVAAALVAGGARDAAPISWIGDDADGAHYRDSLARLGVRTNGVETRAGRTPICILAYQPDGGCHCFYDPGLTQPPDLGEGQRALLAAADCVCLTVGPTDATRAALALARPDATVVWAVKADRRAVPDDLAAALAARADVVVFSRGEANFVVQALAAAGAPSRPRLTVETRGRDGVAIDRAGSIELLPADPIEASDSTGAGDTFLGGFIAALVAGAEPLAATKAGVAAARALLATRTGNEGRG
ncbi:MAG TPA: PfkB family carbohydrate kinase [Roseiarcus sp.]|jgi:ribokinase